MRGQGKAVAFANSARHNGRKSFGQTRWGLAVKIRFETTVENSIAFLRFHHANSPTSRRQRLLLAAVLPLGMAVVLFWPLVGELAWEDPEILFVKYLFSGIFLAGISSAWILAIRWIQNLAMEYNLRRLMAEGSNRTMLGWREMELRDGRLLMNTELIQCSIDLRAIERIVGNEQYVFVYIASIQAYVIPMNLYPEEEYRQFVAELREAWENRDQLRHEPTPRRPDERIVEKPF
jgi:hypothetical protein